MNELLYIGMALSLFIATFVMSKEDKTLNEKILVLWIIFLALPLFSRAIAPDGLDWPIHFIGTGLVYPLTFGPFLWLYVKSLVGDIQMFKRQELLHFIPFILVSLYQIIFVNVPLFPDMGQRGDNVGRLASEWLVLVSLVSYTLLVVWRLHRHSKDVFNHFSVLPTQVTLAWLAKLTVGFLIASSMPLIAPIVSLPAVFSTHAFAYTGFIFILGIFGLKQTQVFKNKIIETELCDVEIQHNLKDIGNNNEISVAVVERAIAEVLITEVPLTENENKKSNRNGKYKNSGLTQERSIEYLKRLESYMLDESPFLDSNLTIEKLAKKICIPRHYLTQVISEKLNKNFYLFVNEYRINAVKTSLCDPKCQRMTMLEIAYESGFNSKSTFNTVFKKITDVTPSQYKILMEQL